MNKVLIGLMMTIASLGSMSLSAQTPYRICIEAAVDYKRTYDYGMNAQVWCSDVETIQEARCRATNLIRKGETGYPSNVKQYCAPTAQDSTDVAFNICLRAALRYKNTYDYGMNANRWCSDITSVEEARCRATNLPRKGQTGYPYNVKEYCL